MKQIVKRLKLNGESTLLANFNKRVSSAFDEVFVLYYKELYMYASYIFKDSDECAEDIIQDIFMRLWDNNEVQFDALPKIKAFIYISIKNAYKNHLKHLDIKERYRGELDFNEQDTTDIQQFEIYSQLEEYLRVLPQDCAKVLKMYIDGYAPEEIAKQLGYQLRTVYNKKQEAKNILKKKIRNGVLHSVLTLIP